MNERSNQQTDNNADDSKYLPDHKAQKIIFICSEFRQSNKIHRMCMFPKHNNGEKTAANLIQANIWNHRSTNVYFSFKFSVFCSFENGNDTKDYTITCYRFMSRIIFFFLLKFKFLFFFFFVKMFIEFIWKRHDFVLSLADIWLLSRNIIISPPLERH